jgi:hypothetical protein
MGLAGKGQGPLPEAVSKPKHPLNCHSERSEESHIFKALRFFTAFRMTEKQVLK